jgi:diguanylate cyclase (GGDEF)-like protein/PAS domain S-box-containing protein/hemerythrin-like metal-binding protein
MSETNNATAGSGPTPLDLREDLFLNAFTYAAIGMALVAPDGSWLKVNGALCALLGYTEAQLMAKTFQDITHPEDLDQDLEYVQRMLAGTIDTYSMEKRYFTAEGRVIHVLLSVSLVKNDDGSPRFFISQIQDITRSKELQDELTRVAKEDYLTRVPNRRFFIEHTTRELTRGERFHEPQALLMIDIDHFKRINDSHGHNVGDEVLKAMAEGCRQTLREVDVFGRLGGEEFGALLLNTDPDVARMIAERVRRNLEQLVVPTAAGPVSFTVSIGLAAFTGGGLSVQDRIRQADSALYRAKDLGRNRVESLSDAPAPAAPAAPAEHLRAAFVQLAWKPEYESGNQLIDSQHRHLFTVANDLLTAIITGLPDADVESAAQELASHTVSHFHDESVIFRDAGYPQAGEHAMIHNGLVRDMNRLIERFKAKEASVGELFDFLAIKVVAEHLLNEDRKFFPYLTPR